MNLYPHEVDEHITKVSVWRSGGESVRHLYIGINASMWPVSHGGGRGPNVAHLPLLYQAIGSELDWKWNSQDTNQYVHRVLVLLAECSPVVPQCQLMTCKLNILKQLSRCFMHTKCVYLFKKLIILSYRSQLLSSCTRIGDLCTNRKIR